MSDYQLEDTLFLPFTTRAFATGVPTALLGTPAIDIYEDATATPIVTGETLVVSLNSVVGFNVITVTATSGSGFNVGGFYTAIIQAGTVGGVSVVGEVVATFSIDASAAAVDLANGTDGLTAIKADTANILTDTGTTLDTKINDIQGATFATGTDSLEAIRNQGDSAWITATGFATPTNITAGTITTATNVTTLNGIAANVITAAATAADFGTEVGNAVWDTDATGRQTQGTFGQAIGDPVADTTTIYQAVATDATGDNVAVDVVALKAETVLILADTDDIGVAGAGLTAINLPNQTMDITGNITGNLSGSVGSVTGAVGSVAGNVDGNVTGSVGSNLELGPAEVNTEVDNALNVTTYAEPGQELPVSTTTIQNKIGYLYKAWRNRSTQTATAYNLFNDDTTTVDQKATVSDNGTTADKNEVETGP